MTMYFSDRITRRFVDAQETIIQTLGLMNQKRVKSLLVFKDTRFLGIITIGDLQRAIIAKVAFDTPIESVVDNSTKRYAKENEDRNQVKVWMLQNRAELMPVLKEDGELTDVVFWEDVVDVQKEELKEDKPLELPVVIMAGGKGTRLKPLTNVIPKPMVPVGEKTIVEEIMDRLFGNLSRNGHGSPWRSKCFFHRAQHLARFPDYREDVAVYHAGRHVNRPATSCWNRRLEHPVGREKPRNRSRRKASRARRRPFPERRRRKTARNRNSPRASIRY